MKGRPTFPDEPEHAEPTQPVPEHAASSAEFRLIGFRIVGTVEARTIDEACEAISAYCDPGNDTDATFEDETPVRQIRFEWFDDEKTASLNFWLGVSRFEP